MSTIGHHYFIAESVVMRRLLALASRIAGSDAPVLITGETGVGKELVARRVHEESVRHHRSLQTLNCSAIPTELFETELFGHRKGAFTGAYRNYDGLALLADGGTLFLDEVSDLSPLHQMKLLRFLQTGEVRRVGETRTQCVDVRIIAATNTSLHQLVEEKKFRLDLFYRLAVLEIKVLPLRERPEDIAPLARYFTQLHGGEGIEIPEEVFEELCRRSWPGNVRELENAVRRMLALREGRKLSITDPLEGVPVAQTPIDWEDTSLASVEKRHILHTLDVVCGGNKARAAKLLGIARHTIENKLKGWGEFETRRKG